MFATLDSGERTEFASGMMRDTQDGKPRFDLMLPLGIPYDEQMLTRFAALLERGARKYTERNWEKASTEDELARAKAGAFRHFMQWMCGEIDEDHAAAVWFNIMEAELVKSRLKQAPEPRHLHTVADLDGLNVGAIVENELGETFRKNGDGDLYPWWDIPNGGVCSSAYVLHGGGAKVVSLS